MQKLTVKPDNIRDLTKRLEAVRARRARLRAETEEAWARYLAACDEAEAAGPDPETGGIPASTQQRLNALGAEAERLERQYREAYHEEGRLSAQILGWNRNGAA